MKKILAFILCLVMVLGMSAVMAGCGGGSDSSSDSEEPAAAEETAQTEDDDSFMYGSWIADTVTRDGQEMSAYDFFNNNTMSWYFSDEGECTLWVGQNQAPLTWELTDTGVILKGDLTYEADFTDDTKTALMWHYDVNGIQAEVLLKHYIEGEEEKEETAE